jgi:hypothetical protein
VCAATAAAAAVLAHTFLYLLLYLLDFYTCLRYSFPPSAAVMTAIAVLGCISLAQQFTRALMLPLT